MKSIVIFSGTTEGRALSEMLSKERIYHTVCVASEYGRDVMEKSDFARIHVGRMDAGEMIKFLSEVSKGQETVLADATHPYAVEASANIRKAAEELGIKIIRVGRASKDVSFTEGLRYADIVECANALKCLPGNILLTTGSKELHTFCTEVPEATRARTYVRVLPSEESLTLCRQEGIEPRHIIAMQGPFGTELNEAIIKQYDIKHLVTKDSGDAGGFREKAEAAKNCKIQLHVIDRPESDEGMSPLDAFLLITGKEAGDLAAEMEISLIGTGMGGHECLTINAAESIAESDAVFGAKRLVDGISHPNKHVMYLPDDIIPLLDKERPKRAVVLFSGDTGFYSGARKMAAAIRKWNPKVSVKSLPGISSFSYLAAKLGESYDDAALFSIHGRSAQENIDKLLETVRIHEKTFVLLSGAEDLAVIAKRLIDSGLEGEICAGSDLSYECEEIHRLTFKEALSYKHSGIVCAFIYNDNPGSPASSDAKGEGRDSCVSVNPQRKPILNIRRDKEFIRSDIPMSKECIRHESIIRLGLKKGDIFFDVGGGTGSVAIEAASLSPEIDVYTIEKNSDALALIKQNVQSFNLGNVTVVEGDAINVLHDMPAPDCVFIGGSGGTLSQIVEILHAKKTGIRFVINAVSLETIEEVRELLKRYQPPDEEAVMLSVTDIIKAGSHHLLKNQNPVWIFSFTI